MEINSGNNANGINAYTANSLDSEKNQVEDQNKASARSDVSQQEAKAAQQAFEVNISQEAQALADSDDTAEQQEQMALEAVEESSQATEEIEASDSGEGEVARHKASQIVNIVA